MNSEFSLDQFTIAESYICTDSLYNFSAYRSAPASFATVKASRASRKSSVGNTFCETINTLIVPATKKTDNKAIIIHVIFFFLPLTIEYLLKKIPGGKAPGIVNDKLLRVIITVSYTHLRAHE